MTRTRWMVSAFIVWHITSLAISSLPTAAWVARAEPPALFPAATAAADVLAGAIAPAIAGLQRGLSYAIGKPVGWYIGITGLGQYWAMFSNPPQFDRYWRIRYYVETPGGRTWTATELVGPSHREDRVRLLQSYRDSYRDKAFEMALDAFIKRRKPSQVEPGTRPEGLPDDLAPIGRFFARRFAATLPEGERIRRTEVWVGTVANKGIGQPVDVSAAMDRRVSLLGYTDGPLEERINVRPYPPYHGFEEEGDIDWVLEYYEES